MSWLSVAAYSFTGTLTSPKDTAPFQMARMGSSDHEYDGGLGLCAPSWRSPSRRCDRMERMRPMLATKGTHVPRGAEWLHEVKWDGIRVLVDVREGGARLTTRNENDVTIAYPELQRPSGLPPGTLIDAEVIALTEGVPRFGAIADRMHVRNARRAEQLSAVNPVTLMAFDLLREGGDDLMSR